MLTCDYFIFVVSIIIIITISFLIHPLLDTDSTTSTKFVIKNKNITLNVLQSKGKFPHKLLRVVNFIIQNSVIKFSKNLQFFEKFSTMRGQTYFLPIFPQKSTFFRTKFTFFPSEWGAYTPSPLRSTTGLRSRVSKSYGFPFVWKSKKNWIPMSLVEVYTLIRKWKWFQRKRHGSGRDQKKKKKNYMLLQFSLLYPAFFNWFYSLFFRCFAQITNSQYTAYSCPPAEHIHIHTSRYVGIGYMYAHFFFFCLPLSIIAWKNALGHLLHRKHIWFSRLSRVIEFYELKKKVRERKCHGKKLHQWKRNYVQFAGVIK